MRRREVEIGQTYAARPRASDRLPARVVVTAVEPRTVRWVDSDSDTGAAGRCLLRDLLGPWEPHAAADRAASELVDRLRELPPEQRWFEAVHVGYGGYANFGVVAHLSVTQAEDIATPALARPDKTWGAGSSWGIMAKVGELARLVTAVLAGFGFRFADARTPWSAGR